MTVVSTTLGLFPLPDDARERLADLKGHQKEDLVSGDESADIEAVYDEARDDLLTRQTDAGLDRAVEGQARWDDMLAHPLAVHENVRTEGIVRYYDNNNFYRDPVVTGDLTHSGDLARDLEKASGRTDALQAVVPGPYSLSRLATDEHYGSSQEFLAAVGDFLAGEVEAFPDAVETVFVLEPSLATDSLDDGEDERVAAAIDAVAAATDAEVVVQSYWGTYGEKLHAHLLDTQVSALGYDLVTAHDDATYLVQEYGTLDSVSLGVVDGQNTLVESPDTIEERIEWFESQIPVSEFDTVYATPNTELFYLPVNKFQAKLRALGALGGDADE
ncbi:5-methyltetrahydropteroyltriglutamate--homocysteine methyltransferase [Salarchaeum japonicum]|uniref:5-methyltetrahydropteroyltriglutamate-- homocysteine methyltransferase n=1 Tax=Salarchaeum japonicum TaxID=555573 RepID=UPI003C783C93